jgi:predicted DNA-binding transcriptional regulator YafY
VDRIEGVVNPAGLGTTPAPADFDPVAEFETSVRSIGADAGPSVATVLVDADRAAGVRRELGDSAVIESRRDGAIVVQVPCSNRLMFRAWLLGFVEHAEVLDPPEVRAEIVGWLSGMIDHG